MTNIEIDEDYKAFKRNNADGVGLYRTEFLFMNRDTLPSEDEHFKAYRKVMRALKGLPLTIRTADLGGDKESNPDVHCTATNPALGLRGIRRGLSEPRMLTSQLRAILRASAFGPAQIMFPMLSNIDEVEQLYEIIDRIKNNLRHEKIKFDENIKLGAMIEVPAAAVTAASFASRLDFLSIGTNDLIQYTLAMDRVDDQVNYLYDPLNPAVLQLIKNTIDAGIKAKISVSMCGEMAGDIQYTKLLLALGLREFSMPANSLLEVKNVLTQTNITKIRRKALAIVNCYDKEKQAKLLEKLNE